MADRRDGNFAVARPGARLDRAAPSRRGPGSTRRLLRVFPPAPLRRVSRHRRSLSAAMSCIVRPVATLVTMTSKRAFGLVIGEAVIPLHEDPAFASPSTPVRMRRHLPVEPTSVQDEVQLAHGDPFLRTALRRPVAAVPQHHAGHVFPSRHHVLKVAVVHRMVLRAHGQSALQRVEAGPLGTAKHLRTPSSSSRKW